MWTRLRNYFLAGVVIVAPIGATIWIVWSVIDWIDRIVTPLVPARANPESYLRFTIPGFGVIVAILLLTLIGFIAANIVGRTLLGAGERVVDRVPVIRALYRAIKQIAETILADRTKNFKNVGLIEYPRKGLYALCLVTTEAKGEIARRVGGGERVYACVVPPSPVPTAGMLLFVRESELTILDMTVEEGAKMIVSMGLVVPDPAALPRLEKKRPQPKQASGKPSPEQPAPAE